MDGELTAGVDYWRGHVVTLADYRVQVRICATAGRALTVTFESPTAAELEWENAARAWLQGDRHPIPKGR